MMKKSIFVLKPLVATILSLISTHSLADAYWIGNDGNYKDDSNWSIGKVPDLSMENIVINKGQANVEFDNNFNGFTQWQGNGHNQIIIGSAQGEAGSLNITVSDELYGIQSDWDSSLIVGADGGQGTFTFDKRGANPDYKNSIGIANKSTLIGDGLQSQGTVNLLGTGKNPSSGGSSPQTAFDTGSLTIGSNGGSGLFNIDGADASINGYVKDFDLNGSPFILGTGANSTGTANILGGGKLVVSYPLSYDPSTDGKVVIGQDGGTGILNILGQKQGVDANGDPITYSSRVHFYNGLVVGTDTNSKGYVNVSDGGELRSFNETVIGKNGGEGHVLVSGENSRFNVLANKNNTTGSSEVDEVGIGELTLGSQGGTGSLTIDDGAVVNIGYWSGYLADETQVNITGGAGALHLTDSADSKGSLIFKGDEGKVGVLNASEIDFGEGQGSIIFNHNDYSANYEFTYELKGGGADHSFLVTQSGVTVLNRDNSQFNGQTLVNGGVLEVNGILGGQLEVNNTGTLTGTGTVGDTVLNTGGTINIGHYKDTQPSTLTIDGNYQGNGGTIIFDTELAGDSSPTDKLIITGDTTGTTNVKVNNLGGLGDKTIQGIELINIQGNSNGIFKQQGRIAAGAYDYYLVRGSDTLNTNPNNWYLTSEHSGNGNITNYLRPEAASYIGLVESNLTAFNHSFHDRQQTLNEHYESSWMRVQYSHDKYLVGQNNQLENKTTRKLLHLGTDLYQKDQLHLGVMIGYSRAEVRTKSDLTNYHSTGNADGYSAGVYATWYDQTPENGGLYIDSYAQYNWFRNKVKGEELEKEVFNTEGHTVSLETGYGLILSKEKQKVWSIEPQVQFIYGSNSALNYTEKNGTRIHIKDQKDQWRSRLGVRFQVQTDQTQLFLTTNYWNQNKYASVTMDDGKVNNNRAKNLFELKTGVQQNLTKQLQVFGQVNGIVGNKSTESYGVSVGLKYKW